MVNKHRALPIFQRGNRLLLGVSDPTDHRALDEIGFATGLATHMVLVEEAKLAAALEQVPALRDWAMLDILNTDLDGLDTTAEGGAQRHDPEPNVDDAPIIRYIIRSFSTLENLQDLFEIQPQLVDDLVALRGVLLGGLTR